MKRSCPRRGPSFEPKAILAMRRASRIIGPGCDAFRSAAFKGLLDKRQAPAELVRLGLGLSLAGEGKWGAATDAVKELQQTNDAALRRAASLLRLKCLNARLHSARAAAVVAGVANESDLGTLSAAFEKELASAMEVDGSWATRMVAAEFFLGLSGDKEFAQRSEAMFLQASALLQKEPATAPPAPAPTAAERLMLEARAASVASVSLKTASVASIVADASASGALQKAAIAYRGELNAAELNDGELVALANASASVLAQHHYFDFFDDSAEYDVWSTPYTRPLAQRIENFSRPSVFILGANALRNRSESIGKPSSGFLGGEEKLTSALASADPLAALRAGGWQAPKSSLAESDAAYFSTVSLVDGFVATHTATEQSLNQLAADALEQLLFRTAVGLAVAKERQGQLHEALSVLNGVISGDRYVEMWKALLARGRVHRNLGNIDESDADFKMLHTLKKPVGGFDIPLLDRNRYQSAF